MRLSYYFVLIFAMQLGLYLIGYSPPLLSLWINQGGVINPAVFLQGIAQALTSDAGVTGILAIVGLALASYFLGFSAMFLIPLSILLFLSNLFVFPSQFLFGNSCTNFIANGPPCTPPFFALPILIIMNMLLIFAYVEFTRGSV